MANNVKVDYEDVFTSIQWDMDKAKYLIQDTQKFFDSPDLDYPDRDHIEAIRAEFKHIAVMLGLVSDMIIKVNETIAPLI